MQADVSLPADGRPTVFVGGESLRQSLATAALTRFASSLTNIYGPTEAAIWATACPLAASAGRMSDCDVVSIGAALPGYTVLVAGANLTPLPPYFIGEIVIAGDCLADGYLHNSDETALKFVAQPYGDRFARGGDSDSSVCKQYERVYRTGDYGWRDEQGQLHFVGRRDLQVKLCGQRSELADMSML